MIMHPHPSPIVAGNLSKNTLVVKQRPTSTYTQPRMYTVHVNVVAYYYYPVRVYTCTCTCMHTVYIHVHVLYTLTLSVSCDPLNRAVPSGWNKTRRTGFDSGVDSESIWKDSRSQILTVLSALPLARRYSLGWNSMDDTAPLCSLKSASNFPAHRSHS